MLVSLLLAAACSSVPLRRGVGSTESPTPGSDPFPPATSGIQIQVADGADMKLEKLLSEFSRVTGMTLQIGPEVRADLSKASTGLNRSIEVPAEQVYPVVETILSRNGFALQLEHAGVPVIASLCSLHQGGSGLRTWALFVDAKNIDRWAEHPAVVITTMLDLPHTDVRTLSNSMRTMFTDANTQQIIPAGNTNTLILTGFGPNVASIARMLSMVDEAAAKVPPQPMPSVEKPR